MSSIKQEFTFPFLHVGQGNRLLEADLVLSTTILQVKAQMQQERITEYDNLIRKQEQNQKKRTFVHTTNQQAIWKKSEKNS